MPLGGTSKPVGLEIEWYTLSYVLHWWC